MKKLLLIASLSLVAMLPNTVGAQSPEPAAVERVPEVESGVEDLLVIGTELLGRPPAFVYNKIRNKSAKTVTHIAFGSGDETDFSGKTYSIFLAPEETGELIFRVSDIVRGLPIRIDGVVYADGSMAGDEKSFKRLRERVARDRIPAPIQKKKFIKIARANEPIELLPVKTKYGAFEFGETFEAGGDWLDGLTLEFKNKTEKKITFIKFAIHLHLDGGRGGGNYLRYGIDPSSAQVVPGAERLLEAGHQDRLTLPLASLEVVRNILRNNHALNDAPALNIALMLVFFEDGTKWEWGRYFEPDPADPAKFIEIQD